MSRVWTKWFHWRTRRQRRIKPLPPRPMHGDPPAPGLGRRRPRRPAPARAAPRPRRAAHPTARTGLPAPPPGPRLRGGRRTRRRSPGRRPRPGRPRLVGAITRVRRASAIAMTASSSASRSRIERATASPSPAAANTTGDSSLDPAHRDAAVVQRPRHRRDPASARSGPAPACAGSWPGHVRPPRGPRHQARPSRRSARRPSPRRCRRRRRTGPAGRRARSPPR